MFALGAQANVIQYFAGISYNNPSELFKIKDYELILGGTGSYADLKFAGSALNFNTFQYEYGINHSRTYTFMPYGRIAKRVNQKLVVGLDVTEPFNSNLNWGNDAFTRYAATQNYLTDVDVSPRAAYSVTQNLQIRAGLNLNFLTKNEVNWAFPTGPTSYANLINRSSSFGLGYDLGATYIFNQTNFLGLTYYSRIRQNTEGFSSLGANYSPNFLFSFNMPATTIISYVHIFSKKWLVNVQAIQSEWNANQYARLFNTAAPPPFSNFTFDMHFNPSYAFVGALRNQVTDKLGLTLLGLIDDGPEHDNLRTIVFPSDTQYFLGIVGDYHFTDQTSVELLYGHVFSNPSIQNRVMTPGGFVPFTTGNITINADVLDLKLKVQV